MTQELVIQNGLMCYKTAVFLLSSKWSFLANWLHNAKIQAETRHRSELPEGPTYFKAEKCNDILKRYGQAKEYLCHLITIIEILLKGLGRLTILTLLSHLSHIL